MKYEVFVVEAGAAFFCGHDQRIAVFENVDEFFMDEIVECIKYLRDVECRYSNAPAEESGVAARPIENEVIYCKDCKKEKCCCK